MAKAALTALVGGDLFPLAFRLYDRRFRTCVGVDLPVAHSVDPASLLGSLHPEEEALCRSMPASDIARSRSWSAGPTKGLPSRSSWPPRCSPTKAIVAPVGPSRLLAKRELSQLCRLRHER